MVLYTCFMGTSLGSLPGPVGHPCGRAAKALDDAGHSYEVRTVKGGTFMPWTWPSRGRDRAESSASAASASCRSSCSTTS